MSDWSKVDVVNIDTKKALAALKGNRAVSFRYKFQGPNQLSYGWLENELLQTDLKVLVSSSGTGDQTVYALNEIGMSAYLHATVKELIAVTEYQQRQIDWIIKKSDPLGLWGSRPT